MLILITWSDFAGISSDGLVEIFGLAIAPEVGVGTKIKDFGWLDGIVAWVSARGTIEIDAAGDDEIGRAHV